MDSLRLHNESSRIIHRIKDLLKPKVESDKRGDVLASPIRRLMDFLGKEGVADDYDKTFSHHGKTAAWLRGQLARRASAQSKLSTVLGEDVIRMRRSGQDTVEFQSLLWLIYKHCFQPEDKEADYFQGVPKELLPDCKEDGSFDFTSSASHFGRIALHHKDTSNTSVVDLVKISYEHEAPPPDLDLGDALCEWMERLKPLKLLKNKWTKEHGDAFDKLKVEIVKSEGAQPEVRAAWYRKLFQQFVSGELDWRQDAVAAKLKAEIPLVLIWSAAGRDQTLKLERVEGGHADHLPNVFIISGALDKLVMAWVAKRPGPTVSLGDPTLSEYKDFIEALREQLTRLKKATPCASINIPKDGRLVEFVLPLAFFRNPVLLVAEYNPPQIPLSLSFNFSIAASKEGNALGIKQLCDWAARCIVTLHNFLSESASLLNDCALEATAKTAGRIGEWATFGHEMKHVAAALSERWLVPPDTGGEIAGYAIAPIPELVSGAGSMIYLWCPPGDIREMLPKWDPNTPLLSQMLEHIWEIALYGILASLAKTKRLDNADSIKEVAAIVGRAKTIWRFSAWWRIEADANALNDPTSLALHRLLRVFSIISNNLIRHASISDGDRICSFTVEASGGVLIKTDTASEPRDKNGNYVNCLTNEFPSLNNVRCGMGGTKSQGLGKIILAEIIETELGGSYVIEANHRHNVQISIPAQQL